MKPPLNQGKEKKTGFVLCPSTKYKSNSIRIPRILFNLWPVHEIWGRQRQRRQRRRGWGRRGRSGPPAKLSPAGEKWNFRAIKEKDKDALFMLFNQLDQLFRCVFFSCTAAGHHQVFHFRLEELRLFERLILCRHNAVVTKPARINAFSKVKLPQVKLDLSYVWSSACISWDCEKGRTNTMEACQTGNREIADR